MTTMPKVADPTTSQTCTYDAWNRLTKVAEGSNTVSEYSYDGAKRRIIQKSYTSGSLTETRHLYYTQPNSWQVLEERVGSSNDAERQFVWGLRYIDDLVLRDRDVERLYAMQDANWNVTGITDAAGTVQERYAYAAYGTPIFLNASFVPQSSAFDWNTLYCGYNYESGMGLFHVRNRSYHSVLGEWLTRDSQLTRRLFSLPLYQYSSSSPINLVDSDGRQAGSANDEKSCKIRVCATNVPGAPGAKHLFTIVDGIGYRCGPSGKGNEDPKCGCQSFGEYGQLVCTAEKYNEDFIDWVEPGKENCEEFEVPNADCAAISNCFANVLKAIESCCVNYTPAPIDNSKGCNSNCAVNWMLSTCFEKTPKVIFGQKPGVAPGYQVPPTECVKKNSKK